MHLVPDSVVQRPLQRAARLRRAARRSPASRSSATSSTTSGTACRRRWACSTCSIRAPGGPSRSSTPPALTDMRTGAVTAIGAKHLARKSEPRARPHRRARHRVLERAAARSASSTSTRSACTRGGPKAATPSRERLVARPRQAGHRDRRLGILRARRRHRRRGVAPRQRRSRCCGPSGSSRGAFVVPYGTMSAVELSLTDIMDKIVVDDWGQCRSGAVRQPARARRRRQAHRGDAARGARRDRRRPQAGPRARRRDDPALASRPVAVRHRARRGDAREGATHGHRPAAPLCVTRDRAAARCDDRQRADVLAGRRDGRRVADVARVGGPPRGRRVRGHRLSRRRSRCRRCGRVRISAARSCAAIRSRTRRRGRRCSPRPCRARAQYGGQPVYWTDLVVAADAPIADLPMPSASASRGPPRTRNRASRRRAAARGLRQRAWRAAVRGDGGAARHAAQRRRSRSPTDAPTSVRSTAMRTTSCACTSPRSRPAARDRADVRPRPFRRSWVRHGMDADGRAAAAGGARCRSAHAPSSRAAREALLLSGFAAVAADVVRRAASRMRVVPTRSVIRALPETGVSPPIDTPRHRVKNAAFHVRPA